MAVEICRTGICGAVSVSVEALTMLVVVFCVAELLLLLSPLKICCANVVVDDESVGDGIGENVVVGVENFLSHTSHSRAMLLDIDCCIGFDSLENDD